MADANHQKSKEWEAETESIAAGRLNQVPCKALNYFHVVKFRSERAIAMPRKPDPGNEYFRVATERSRRKAAVEGRPEASFADAALAAAVFAYAKRVEEEKADTAALRWIIKAAAAILAAHPRRSFDFAEAERKVIQRAGMRKRVDDRRIKKLTKPIILPKAIQGVSK
ncbi:hypothetical protein ACCS95_33550 [Rhizobium ruizarguesonis]